MGYIEGFSQSSMWSAYVAVCFADRITGVWQGGSGLAKTGHAPVTPGWQGQCSLSDYLDNGNDCCNTNYCEECAWWPIYPRTCENKIIDCMGSYTNDNIACGSDYYMYEAMVKEGNDARLLSFSPSADNNGGHKNPSNQYDWMVGCDTGCAPTLEMMKFSEDPVVSLSEGKFGTQTGLPSTGNNAIRPVCEKEFGAFEDENVNADNKCNPSVFVIPPEFDDIQQCENTGKPKCVDPTSRITITNKKGTKTKKQKCNKVSLKKCNWRTEDGQKVYKTCPVKCESKIPDKQLAKLWCEHE